MKGLNWFAKYAWGVLAFNVGVILWGAYVRATGSGAGCGSHWPMCNGVVVPRAPALETMIEFTHRVTSGVALLLVLGLLIWAWRGFPKGHVVRLGAVLSSVFIITEALVGAGLVLFGWTAQNASAVPTAIHLVNTFLLLASLALTGYWASGGGQLVLRDQGLVIWTLAFGLLGVLFVGVSGAITALGDTLFPASTLAEGLRQDFETGSHFLIRLRVWHPVIAILVGLYLIFVSTLLALLRTNPAIRRAAVSLAVLFVFQLAAGLVNVLLLAPVWMQIIHLLLADIVWITLVILTALTVNRSEVERLEFEASQSLGGFNPQGINSLS
jgi:protoheme IX farnesyltransferase